MVQLFLEALAKPEPGQEPIQFYHVDSRVSSGAEDVGSMRFAKIFLILKYCFQAIVLRLRHGITHFYYVPANPSRAALYRDWIVMALCRPFFKKIIFHWHASGLGEWLETEAKPWERKISSLFLWKPDLSIVLAEFNRADAERFNPKKVIVVPNGIPDPCPDFDADILPLRKERIALRRAVLLEGHQTSHVSATKAQVFRVLYLSLCHRPKGLFDTMEGVVLANQRTPPGIRLELTVAGAFWNEEEKQEFEQQMARSEMVKDERPFVHYVGFASGIQKKQLFLESDCFCFPTYYSAESFGLVLLEAMAFGLPIVTTRWRMIPEVVPPGYAGVVEPRCPKAISTLLLQLLSGNYDDSLRNRFSSFFTVEHFGANIKSALMQA